MFILQGVELGAVTGGKAVLSDLSLKLVRTYKGEINRTQTGMIATFPNSFVTVGFDFKFLGSRSVLRTVEQIFLSADKVELAFDFDGTSLKGEFSCTANAVTELHAKDDKQVELTISVVSDGSNITDASGNAFHVKDANDTVATLEDPCYFGKVYKLKPAYLAYKLDGYTLPDGKILVLGNHTLTAP